MKLNFTQGVLIFISLVLLVALIYDISQGGNNLILYSSVLILSIAFFGGYTMYVNKQEKRQKKMKKIWRDRIYNTKKQ